MRAIWTGHIRLSLVTVPVRVYSAVKREEEISFNQLHEKDMGRVAYVKRCKTCGEELSADDIVKGYQVDKDRYVVIEDEALDALKVESTKVLEIEGFVDADEVSPLLFEQPYYAGPDGPVAAKTYALLHHAMKEKGKLGVGRVVLRGRETVMAVRPEGDGLLLFQLRFPSEVQDATTIPGLAPDVAPNQKEVALAATLIETLSIPFAELELHDRYADAVRDLVAAKVEGREIVTVESPEAAGPITDIASALQASIDAAKQARKPMRKAATASSESTAKPRRKTG